MTVAKAKAGANKTYIVQVSLKIVNIFIFEATGLIMINMFALSHKSARVTRLGDVLSIEQHVLDTNAGKQ